MPRVQDAEVSSTCLFFDRLYGKQVFGDKLDWFLKKFERSFESTLRTLRSISELSARTGVCFSSKRKEEKIEVDSTLDRKRDVTRSSRLEECRPEESSRTIAPIDQLSSVEVVKESISDSLTHELALCKLKSDVTSVAPRAVGSHRNEIALGTFEKSVVEQARSNDLKTVELGLAMRKLRLKETQIALNCDLNNLERSKLAMGISKACFKEEKFKNQLEDTRHSELLRKCIDCLVAGLLIMSMAISYGAYVFSYQKISEATAICTPSTKASLAPSFCYGLYRTLVDLQFKNHILCYATVDEFFHHILLELKAKAFIQRTYLRLCGLYRNQNLGGYQILWHL